MLYRNGIEHDLDVCVCNYPYVNFCARPWAWVCMCISGNMESSAADIDLDSEVSGVQTREKEDMAEMTGVSDRECDDEVVGKEVEEKTSEETDLPADFSIKAGHYNFSKPIPDFKGTHEIVFARAEWLFDKNVPTVMRDGNSLEVSIRANPKIQVGQEFICCEVKFPSLVSKKFLIMGFSPDKKNPERSVVFLLNPECNAFNACYLDYGWIPETTGYTPDLAMAHFEALGVWLTTSWDSRKPDSRKDLLMRPVRSDAVGFKSMRLKAKRDKAERDQEPKHDQEPKQPADIPKGTPRSKKFRPSSGDSELLASGNVNNSGTCNHAKEIKSLKSDIASLEKKVKFLCGELESAQKKDSKRILLLEKQFASLKKANKPSKASPVIKSQRSIELPPPAPLASQMQCIQPGFFPNMPVQAAYYHGIPGAAMTTPPRPLPGQMPKVLQMPDGTFREVVSYSSFS